MSVNEAAIKVENDEIQKDVPKWSLTFNNCMQSSIYSKNFIISNFLSLYFMKESGIRKSLNM